MSDNTVVNIIAADSLANAEIGTNAICIQFDGNNPAGIGYTYDSNTGRFSPPPPPPVYCTVTFAGNGGVGTMDPQTDYQPAVLSANIFTLKNYAFTGWNTVYDGSGDAYSDGATYPFTTDNTLYAQWA